MDIFKFCQFSGKAREAGITLIPAIVVTDAVEAVLPSWLNITLGYSELSKQKIREYDVKFNETFTGGYTFLSFTWEPSIFLPYLQTKFLEGGGRIIKRSISDLQELKDSNYDLIVNCTGLELNTLAGRLPKD